MIVDISKKQGQKSLNYLLTYFNYFSSDFELNDAICQWSCMLNDHNTFKGRMNRVIYLFIIIHKNYLTGFGCKLFTLYLLL